MSGGDESLAGLVADGVTDAELAALVWLLVEGGVPLVVTGDVAQGSRSRVAAAVLGADPERPWVLLDADAEPPSARSVAAILGAGTHLGLTLRAGGLAAVLERLAAPPSGLPEDAVRRLGLVVVLGKDGAGALRAIAVHYLRPTERDGQGHVQRRPPAVLATWDADAGAFEHFAWGITPELAERVDREQADLEERQDARADFISGLVSAGHTGTDAWATAVRVHLAAEPLQRRAPLREPARPSPFRGGPTDPHVH